MSSENSGTMYNFGSTQNSYSNPLLATNSCIGKFADFQTNNNFGTKQGNNNLDFSQNEILSSGAIHRSLMAIGESFDNVAFAVELLSKQNTNSFNSISEDIKQFRETSEKNNLKEKSFYLEESRRSKHRHPENDEKSIEQFQYSQQLHLDVFFYRFGRFGFKSFFFFSKTD